MFCVFHEFCGSKYLCKSVKSVGEYSLSVCSVNSVNSVEVLFWLRGYGKDAIPSYVGDKCTPLKLLQQERRFYAQIDASRKTHLIIIVIHLVANDEVVRGQRVEHISLHAP